MKYFLITVSLIFNLSNFAQENWTLISPLPTQFDLFGCHFISENEGWIAGINATIFHTEDGGENWIKQYEDDSFILYDIFFLNENEGWATGWDYIMHTTDGGNNWEVKNLPMIFSVDDIFFLNSDTGWIAGTYELIYKTVDGGENWTTVNFGNSSSASIEEIYFFDELNGLVVGRYYSAGSYSFVSITTDGGESWQEKEIGDYKGLNSLFVRNDSVWACGTGSEIILSTDKGMSWTTIANIDSFNNNIYFKDSQNGIVTKSHKSWRTTDGGLNWFESDYISGVNGINKSHFFNNSIFSVGFNGDVIKSSDLGENWVRAGSDHFQTPLNIYFKDTLNSYATAQYSHSLLASHDGGYTWDYQDIGALSTLSQLSFANSEVGYALSSTQLFKTVDGGINWSSTPISISGIPQKMKFINESVGFIVCSNGKFYKTVDGGLTWTSSYANTPHTILDIEIKGENIWIISSSGEIIKSTDEGVSWGEPQYGFGNLKDIFFYNEQKGFAVNTNGDLFQTTNSGESWELISTFPYTYYTIKIWFISEDEGWIIANSRLYYTVDGGETWELTLIHQSMYDIFFLDEYHGWITGEESLVLKYNKNYVGVQPNAIKTEILLFPNPTSDFLNVDLNGNKYQNINIYDIEGKCYQNISVKQKQSLSIDISPLPDGVYFMEFRGKQQREIIEVIKKK